MNTSNCDLRKVFNWGSPPMRERSRERETKRKRFLAGEAEEDEARIGVHDFSVLPIDTIADLRGGLH